MEAHVVGAKSQRQRYILGSAPYVCLGTIALIGGATWLLPQADAPIAPFSLAAEWSFVAMLPYVAVCLVILANRLTEGSHNPTVGAETASLKIHCRVMQNTLEQLVWFVLCVFPLSTRLLPEEAHFVPIVALYFVAARLVYWRGYFLNGTLGRRYGVQMTFALNIGLLGLTGAALIFR
jgi:uncharacterized membrane protein YecN with MAPEG domain